MIRKAKQTLWLRFFTYLMFTLLAALPLASLIILFTNARTNTIGWLVLLTIFVSPILIFWLGQSLSALLRSILDLLDGPRLITGYVTFRYDWVRAGRQNYSLNIVPANNFDRWRGKTALQSPKPNNFDEAHYYYIPSVNEIKESSKPLLPETTYGLPDVITLSPPNWAYERVRLGDLVRLLYSPYNKVIFEIEVILTIDLEDNYARG
jgi:hypothetical protein